MFPSLACFLTFGCPTSNNNWVICMSQVNLQLEEHALPNSASGSIQTPGRFAYHHETNFCPGQTPTTHLSFAMILLRLETLLGGMTGALQTSMVRTGCLQNNDIMSPSRMVWTCLQLSRGPRTSRICSNPPQARLHLG